MKNALLTIFFSIVNAVMIAQTATDACGSAPSITLPAANSTGCFTVTSVGSTNDFSGTAYCATGNASNNHDVWYKFTTPNVTQAALDCFKFDLTKGTATGDIQIRLFSSCTTPVGGVLGCSTTSSTTASSSDATTASNWAPNTTYYVQMSNNGTYGTMNFCLTRTDRATNDECSGATQISPTPQTGNNNPACLYTAGASDPAPAQFCAGSLENTSWFKFTTSATCTPTCQVVLSLTNITCVGGGSGFQIGYFNGSCPTSTSTSFGCQSGSGGTVTTTISPLTAGQNILLGIDGNAGANCTFSISATNTTPLPLKLLDFTATKYSNFVQLDWVTAGSDNAKYYEIEKTTDFSYYEIVGSVNSSNSFSTNNKYSLIDKSPSEGISYYRIKQVDKTEEVFYSQAVSVIYEGIENLDFKVVPNPNQENFISNLVFKKVPDGVINVSVLDINGSIIYEYNGKIDSEKFDMPNKFVAGFYIIKVTGTGAVYTKHMLIK